MSEHKHPANVARHDDRDFGQRSADAVARNFGSWRYLIIQTVAVAVWIVLNMCGWFVWHWDPYPFILLNLVFSTQASYAAPLILLSQNRSAEHDRVRAEHDYEVNEADSEVNRQALAKIEENTALTQESAARIERIVTHLGITE